VVIGLDGLEPSLVDRFAMPNLRALGRIQRLASCNPPITVPAWACMVTGADPGELGLYGFHDRSAWDYTSRRLASSLAFDQPTLWELATRAGLRSRIIGVPPSYPARPLNGALVTCFLTPDDAEAFTYPAELTGEVRGHGYVFDTPEFRVGDASAKAALADDIARMIERRFALARDWLARDDWDLFMMVEMGTDRAHHAFWLTPERIEAIYAQVDAELGKTLAHVRPDDEVLVVSDHGACALKGGFAINDWLARHGLLALKSRERRRFSADNVDWSRTSAWADGGYVGRIHVNLKGREPLGLVTDPARLLERIQSLPADVPLVFTKPEDVYKSVRGYPPALMVEAGNLEYRCLASTGHLHGVVAANDTGPDDANHGRDGVLVSKSDITAASLYDIAPLVKSWLSY
jgi:predicted AlkP superfamily phosphohydrolase/phosphomutase